MAELTVYKYYDNEKNYSPSSIIPLSISHESM